ncbi:Uncharacterised protein [Legionella bozemanae]|uniref:Transferrin-like domain-containing protein n=1 Tax=Legionella bozemanae TaxID=447 RepID=A0A0W0RZ41_LEGBO|nr:hypothetical protein Lboz_0520 [Legionella bozemanae]STO35315.1 Uncharacterised protein [Legionella bozemanae]
MKNASHNREVAIVNPGSALLHPGYNSNARTGYPLTYPNAAFLGLLPSKSNKAKSASSASSAGRAGVA